MCIFCSIIKNEIPSTKLYEDDDFIIIKDIYPKAKIHLLAIPKTHYALIEDASEKSIADLGKILKKISALKDMLGVSKGYRLIINQGEDGNQTVHHLHIHILGGQFMN